MERRRNVDNALRTIYFTKQSRLGASKLAKYHARPFILALNRFDFKMNKMYVKEEKAPKNKNKGDITLEEKEKQIRRNKIRFFVEHSKEVLDTCKMLENKIDAIIEKVV